MPYIRRLSPVLSGSLLFLSAPLDQVLSLAHCSESIDHYKLYSGVPDVRLTLEERIVFVLKECIRWSNERESARGWRRDVYSTLGPGLDLQNPEGGNPSAGPLGLTGQ